MPGKTGALFIIFILITATTGYAESIPRPAQDIGGPVVFSIAPPEDPLIDFYVKEYLTENGKKTLKAIMERGAPYLGFIYDELIEKGLPPELMYLPAIESGFKAWAVSGSGAAGLWQFMMNSISPYEISVNEWQDDRRDFWKSTEAAVHKLEFNYSRLGSWPLAIAAYNCGLGRVERAVKAAGTDNYIELYELGYLPRQTRLYVPKFFAFCFVAGYPSRCGTDHTVADDLYNPRRTVKWERLKMEQAADLRLLADQADVPYEILREANAELRYSITPPAADGYFLKVPACYSDNIKSALDKAEQPLVRFYIHVINSGDTYYALSRHFGVSVEMIEACNPSADAAKLRTGQRIIIPAVKETEPFRSGGTESSRWVNADRYTVKSGDTLWAIARMYNTSAEEIAFNNGIDAGGILKAGTVLQVPGEN